MWGSRRVNDDHPATIAAPLPGARGALFLSILADLPWRAFHPIHLPGTCRLFSCHGTVALRDPFANPGVSRRRHHSGARLERAGAYLVWHLLPYRPRGALAADRG